MLFSDILYLKYLLKFHHVALTLEFILVLTFFSLYLYVYLFLDMMSWVAKPSATDIGVLFTAPTNYYTV